MCTRSTWDSGRRSVSSEQAATHRWPGDSLDGAFPNDVFAGLDSVVGQVLQHPLVMRGLRLHAHQPRGQAAEPRGEEIRDHRPPRVARAQLDERVCVARGQNGLANVEPLEYARVVGKDLLGTVEVEEELVLELLVGGDAGVEAPPLEAADPGADRLAIDRAALEGEGLECFGVAGHGSAQVRRG
jgi:hypothetical protein